jgi:hypothetical protein
MGCGAPVVCSDTGALPEWAGSAALLVPPNHIERWVGAFQRWRGDLEVREEMRRRGFERASNCRWETAVQSFLTSLRSAVDDVVESKGEPRGTGTGDGEGSPSEGWDEAVLSIEGGDPEGEDESLGVEGATRRRVGFPYVRFPRLALPLPGVEPKGLEETRPVLEKPPAPEEPKVTVLLYNHNDSDRLWNLMFALKAQTRVPDEILLVDNHSEDASVSFLRGNYPEVRVMELQEVFPEDRRGTWGSWPRRGIWWRWSTCPWRSLPSGCDAPSRRSRRGRWTPEGSSARWSAPRARRAPRSIMCWGGWWGPRRPSREGNLLRSPRAPGWRGVGSSKRGPTRRIFPGGRIPFRRDGVFAPWGPTRPGRSTRGSSDRPRRSSRRPLPFGSTSSGTSPSPGLLDLRGKVHPPQARAPVVPRGGGPPVRSLVPSGRFLLGTLLGLLLVPFTLWGVGKVGRRSPGKTVPDKEVLSGSPRGSRPGWGVRLAVERLLRGLPDRRGSAHAGDARPHGRAARDSFRLRLRRPWVSMGHPLFDTPGRPT